MSRFVCLLVPFVGDFDSQYEERLSSTSDSLTLFWDDPIDSSLDFIIFWPDPLWGLRLVDPRDCWLVLEPMIEMDPFLDTMELLLESELLLFLEDSLEIVSWLLLLFSKNMSFFGLLLFGGGRGGYNFFGADPSTVVDSFWLFSDL